MGERLVMLQLQLRYEFEFDQLVSEEARRRDISRGGFGSCAVSLRTRLTEMRYLIIRLGCKLIKAGGQKRDRM